MAFILQIFIIFISLLSKSISFTFNNPQFGLKTSSYNNIKKKILKMSFSDLVLSSISKEISGANHKEFVASSSSSVSGGGGGASVGIIKDENSNQEYFVKMASTDSGYDMLNAEYLGIKEIYDSNTIRVPQPICIGSTDFNSFVVFEKISMGGRSSPTRASEAGRLLAKMHKTYSKNGQYGWKINNTIGATIQPNVWTSSWAEFWDQHRLGHMMNLANKHGATFSNEIKTELREKVKIILELHSNCKPSLVHGDLWSGNQAYTSSGEYVIYDPASYYADREVDLAMTKLFGLQSSQFYDAYEEEYPLNDVEHYEIRTTIYNLYHILNHYVLFGGGYLSTAHNMIGKILKYEL